MNEINPSYEEVTFLSGNAASWEWDSVGIAYRDGFYYWTGQSGCSCNWFEWPGAAGEGSHMRGWDARGTKHEAVTYLQGLTRGEGEFEFSPNVVDRAIQEVLTHRPGRTK